MTWGVVSVVLGFAGLAVLAACSVRVYLGVRRLGRELRRTRRLLEPQHSTLRDELQHLQDARTAREAE